uniref:Uncharacterized protein n=1 Tax=Anguilla anguilla TaxID=7936 RepID=A0A0E9URH2_ANGAN
MFYSINCCFNADCLARIVQTALLIKQQAAKATMQKQH